MSDTDRRAAPPLPDPPNQGFNAALQGPVLGIEPDFLRALPIDNLVGTIVALTAEVWMLRERLGTLEAELTARKVLPAGAVEGHTGGPEEQQARAAELASYTQRVLAELARDRHPVSSIDPRVAQFLTPR